MSDGHGIDLALLNSRGTAPWRALGRHRRLIVLGVLLGLAGAAAALAQPALIGALVAAVDDGRPLTGLLLAGAALFLGDALLGALHAYVISRAGENIVYDLRGALSSRLLRSRFASYQRWPQGDVFSRMVADTSLARATMTYAVDEIASSAFMLVGGLVLMIWVDWLLLLVTVGCLGVTSLVSLFIAHRVRVESVANRADVSNFGTALIRVLGALPTVKASRAEKREAEDLAHIAHQARRSGLKVSVLASMLDPVTNVGLQLALTVVITLGAARTGSGAMEAANLTEFILYLFYLIGPLISLFTAIAQFQLGRASIDRLADLGTVELEEAEPEEPPRALSLVKTGEPGLVFDGVSFTYPGKEQPVLENVSFTVPSRGLTAIVGPSGSGKTTLFQLVERFHDPDSGTIRLDGTDIARLPLTELRSAVGYVDQDHTLLSGTLRENLLYAAPDTGDEYLAPALSLAHLTDVVDELPDGLDTVLGDAGRGLSGGQRQRLAIARTILQTPGYLLLDEATANLDSASEKALRDTIAMLSEYCAVVAIAHRLSTVVQAEHIIVLDRGRVRAEGTHSELVREDELYRDLAAFQQLG
ncbi:ABC transporter ATP-binding protein [Streptomyces sp. 4F14]|uniref:ABC transporter ATP-binding protein n=1 Tax=Streptomyces sp. 4F14 TaxID=3394380 RepID=UPI003A875BF9